MNESNKMSGQGNGQQQQQAEKSTHYLYLKDFRVEQCPLFLQHKCTQHRPFTCFHWHFMNQRRRRPLRKRDGSFNYSPDVYCSKYDETTGICPDGNDCPFLHRTAGDTERRYHLRYFKTASCVHETDSKGQCSKNGAHCAFAHGPGDLRPPVYDIRELTAIETGENLSYSEVDPSTGGTPSSVEKERSIQSEDPKWQDARYVLINYKTEPCRRPPRLCRQGYACPSYHNSRDRRRSPKMYKLYRSTPCPNVKQGDEWGEPGNCDKGDSCSYCHTRTEQQFHPEIYKSTKCNDMQQTAYCPRGPFCAFAHNENEMSLSKEKELVSCLSTPGGSKDSLPSLSDSFPCSAYRTGQLSLPHSQGLSGPFSKTGPAVMKASDLMRSRKFSGPAALGPSSSGVSGVSTGVTGVPLTSTLTSSLTSSLLSSTSLTEVNQPHHHHHPLHLTSSNGLQGGYLAGGAGRQARSMSLSSGSHHPHYTQRAGQLPPAGLGGLGLGSGGPELGQSPSYLKAPGSERDIHNMMRRHLSLGETVGMPLSSSSNVATSNTSLSSGSALSPLVLSDVKSHDTQEKGVLDQFPFDDLLSQSMEKADDGNSICSSLNASLVASNGIAEMLRPSAPEAIPASLDANNGSVFGLSPPAALFPQPHDQAAGFLSSSPFMAGQQYSGSPFTTSLFPTSSSSGLSQQDLHKVRDEWVASKARVASMEENLKQLRNACDAWRKKSEEQTNKVSLLEHEKRQFLLEKSECHHKLRMLEDQMKQPMSQLFALLSLEDLSALPFINLLTLQIMLTQSLDRVNKAIAANQESGCCTSCGSSEQTVTPAACHRVMLCPDCQTRCPICVCTATTTTTTSTPPHPDDPLPHHPHGVFLADQPPQTAATVTQPPQTTSGAVT